MNVRLLLCAALLTAIPFTLGADEAPADWFLADPYSELGFDTTFGDGMNLMALLAHPRSAAEIKLTKAQQVSLAELKKAHQELDSAKQKTLIALHGKLGDEWVKWRTENWNDAANLAKTMITAEQGQRLDQLFIQKQGFRGFLHEGTAKALDLTAEQKAAVRKAITDHSARPRDRDAKPTEGIEERKARTAAGVASHRELWNDVFKALTPEQRKKYLELRGKIAGK